MNCIYTLLIFFSFIFSQNNPLNTATAGAFHARSFGNHSIQNNPAFLGKFGKTIVLGGLAGIHPAITFPSSSNIFGS